MSATTTFFRSRWIEPPGHVTELDPHALPAGFRAAGVAAGLKPEGLDVGVLVSRRARRRCRPRASPPTRAWARR